MWFCRVAVQSGWKSVSSSLPPGLTTVFRTTQRRCYYLCAEWRWCIPKNQGQSLFTAGRAVFSDLLLNAWSWMLRLHLMNFSPEDFWNIRWRWRQMFLSALHLWRRRCLQPDDIYLFITEVAQDLQKLNILWGVSYEKITKKTTLQETVQSAHKFDNIIQAFTSRNSVCQCQNVLSNTYSVVNKAICIWDKSSPELRINFQNH